MPLVKMGKLLKAAKEKNIGCGSFSIYSMESLMGTIRAAEELQTSVILQLAEKRFSTAPLSLVGPMMISAAEHSNLDIAVHLDHGCSFGVIQQALDMGFTSVMYDGSMLSFDENVEYTQRTMELAGRYGADVEAELGMMGVSEDGRENYGTKWTDPAAAVRFVEKTHVDALALAIGNQHGNYKETPDLQFGIIEKVRKEMPEQILVLHGGSGIPDDEFQQCIRSGITKVNIATAILNHEIQEGKRYLLEAAAPNYYDLNSELVNAAYEVVAHHIRVFNLEK